MGVVVGLLLWPWLEPSYVLYVVENYVFDMGDLVWPFVMQSPESRFRISIALHMGSFCYFIGVSKVLHALGVYIILDLEVY